MFFFSRKKKKRAKIGQVWDDLNLANSSWYLPTKLKKFLRSIPEDCISPTTVAYRERTVLNVYCLTLTEWLDKLDFILNTIVSNEEKFYNWHMLEVTKRQHAVSLDNFLTDWTSDKAGIQNIISVIMDSMSRIENLGVTQTPIYLERHVYDILQLIRATIIDLNQGSDTM